MLIPSFLLSSARNFSLFTAASSALPIPINQKIIKIALATAGLSTSLSKEMEWGIALSVACTQFLSVGFKSIGFSSDNALKISSAATAIVFDLSCKVLRYLEDKQDFLWENDALQHRPAIHRRRQGFLI